MLLPLLDLQDELTRIVSTLDARGVDYALCGGLALAVHGADGVLGALRVVSREGLITMKLAAGRPQDVVDVKRLDEVARG